MAKRLSGRRPKAAEKVGTVTPAPAVGKREANKRDKRGRVVEAAWALFSTQGFEQTTTTAVAQAAGIAKGTLFLYASDKTDLLFLLMHDRLERSSREALSAVVAGAPLVEQVMQVFGRLYRMYAETGEVGRRFVQALPGAKGPNAERVNALTVAFLHRLTAMIIEAQGRGEVRGEVDAMKAAMAMFGVYFSGLMLWLQGLAEGPALESILRDFVTLMFEGLEVRARKAPSLQ